MLFNLHSLTLKIGVLRFKVECFIQSITFENLEIVKEISSRKGTLFLGNILTIVLKHFIFF